jgi:hypothetical protein
VDVSGWNLSRMNGQAREQRPSWDYNRFLGEQRRTVDAALDVQIGVGQVPAGLSACPPAMAATESWPPNVALATSCLHPRGVGDPDELPLPFADVAFDLVCSRTPVAGRPPRPRSWSLGGVSPARCQVAVASLEQAVQAVADEAEGE